MPEHQNRGAFLERTARFLFAGSIRRVLVTIVLASVLPALGIILYTGLEAREHAIHDAEASTLLLARSIGEIQERTTQSILQLLVVLSKAPQVLDVQEPATSQFLADVAAANPVLSNIVVVGLDGNYLASARPCGSLNISDRTYYRKAVEGNSFAAGEYMVSRSVNAPVFPFAYPLRNAAGRVTGAVSTGISLGAYQILFAHAPLPPDSVMIIADRNGKRLCRFPMDEAIKVGTLISPEMARAIAGSGGHGTVRLTGLDGVKRIYSFTQLALSQKEPPYISIVVGIPEKTGLTAANELLKRNLILLALATLLALGTAWILGKLMLGRRVGNLLAVTEALRGGDLTARLPNPLALGELGRLEASVNDMARTLADNAEAQKRYEEAIQVSYEEMEARVDDRTRELREANSRLTEVIEQRAQVQEALRQSEEKHRALYEHSPAGIFLVEPRGHILDANPAALEMLGYTFEEITRKTYRDLICPENLGTVPVDVRALHAGETIRAERVFMTKNGGSIAVDVTGRTVTPDMFQVVFKDATERKKLEQLREDVDRITRHDLKTPLLSMVHVPVLLLRDPNLTDKQRDFLTIMRDAGFRMLRTINMSLALYRMEAKTYQCDRVYFDLLATVNLMVRENAPYAQTHQVALALLLDQAPPGDQDRFPLLGEEDLCVTMLENLVRNAIEASPAGGTVVLDLDSRARTLTIRNKGEVPTAIRDRFFEKYATSGKKWGTGLGTYSARLIATTLGWDIRLDTSAPGETSVEIRFPPV